MGDGIGSSGCGWRRRTFVTAGAAVITGTLALGSVAVGLPAGATASAAAKKPAVLRVMVTNDDGVGAPGIDAAVQALRKLPRTNVTVVAPLTNQSGTGGKTTAGRLVVSKATTASAYPATAVHGYPADTVVWAVKDHGIGRRPDLVVSGINFGENVGPLATVSGTVGAAREAVRLGIPALAASQGVDNGSAPDFAEGAAQLVAWVTSHRAALLAHRYRKPPAASLNVPTCPGTVRGPVSAPLALTITGIDLGQVDCTSTPTTTTFASDARRSSTGTPSCRRCTRPARALVPPGPSAAAGNVCPPLRSLAHRIRRSGRMLAGGDGGRYLRDCPRRTYGGRPPHRIPAVGRAFRSWGEYRAPEPPGAAVSRVGSR